MFNLQKSTITALLAIIGGMLIFKSTTHLSYIENLIQKYPLFVIILALLLVINRNKIADKIPGVR